MCVALLLIALVASSALAEIEGPCTDVEVGPFADVCSELQNILQLALVQNPTNIYKIKKVFSKPTPPLVNAVYNISITNLPSETPINCTEISTSNGACIRLITEDNIWTDIGLFTIIHPGIIQQLQLQFPYFMINLAEQIVTEDSLSDFVLSAAQWDGCGSENMSIPSVTLSLTINYDDLSHTLSEELLCSSVEELTTWLRAFENTQPQMSPSQALPEIDIASKAFALRFDPVRSEHEGHVKRLEVGGAFLIYFLSLGICIVIIVLAKDASGKDEFIGISEFIHTIHVPGFVFMTSVTILVLGLESLSLFIRMHYNLASGCYPNSYNHVVLFRLIILVCTAFTYTIAPFYVIVVLLYNKYCRHKKTTCEYIYTTVLKAFAFCIFFTFTLFCFKGALAALLLAYAYPYAVLSATILFITSTVFLLLLFCYIVIALTEYCSSRKKPYEKVCVKILLYVVSPFLCIILIASVNIGLLAIFGVAIVERQVDISGIAGTTLSVLISALFGVGSWFLKSLISFNEWKIDTLYFVLRKWKVAVILSSGRTISLKLKRSDKIKDVKAMIRDMEGISRDQQLLITFRGHLLKDCDVLSKLDVQKQNTLHLVLHLKQGMLIFVETRTGKTSALELTSSDQIKSIKIKIEANEGIPKEQQRLFFKDREDELEDEKPLSEYNIQEQDTLYLALKVLIMTPTGETIPLDFKSTDTIENVKAKIQEKKQIPPEQQLLIFKGCLLEDNKTLSQCEIQEHDSLSLHVRGKVLIFVKTPTGSIIPLQVMLDDGIKTVKDKIKKKEKIPEQQQLTFNEERLEDECTLRHYHIEEHSFLHYTSTV